jgi:hypothetical protein
MARTPERSLAQRMEALHQANEVRTRRAILKKDLKAGRESFNYLLMDPPKCLETAKVYDILKAVPTYGKSKTYKTLKECRISTAKTIVGLSERQRAELISKVG